MLNKLDSFLILFYNTYTYDRFVALVNQSAYYSGNDFDQPFRINAH